MEFFGTTVTAVTTVIAVITAARTVITVTTSTTVAWVDWKVGLSPPLILLRSLFQKGVRRTDRYTTRLLELLRAAKRGKVKKS